MKLLICGDRKWKNREYMLSVLSALKSDLGDYTIVEGEATGADAMSRSIAELFLMLPVEPYPANWDLYGRAAGPIRNSDMLKTGKPNGVVAFHKNLIQSKGTKNMVEQAMKANVPTLLLPCSNSQTAYNRFIAEIQYRKDHNGNCESSEVVR